MVLDPRETPNTQGCLSVSRLGAKGFENESRYEDIFSLKGTLELEQNASKVSIVESPHGGWRYNLLKYNPVNVLE